MDVANTPITLPHKIIEIILSKIPLKYLCRFKSVSKKWNSTISDPRFAETHLQESKKKSNLVAWEEETDLIQGLITTKLHNNKFRFVSAIQRPWEERFVKSMSDIVCYSDGLYLKPCQDYYSKKQKYVLWNPSTRTYRKLSCPYPVDPRMVLYGICYDPLTKDYKVVIGDMKHYAVFSCRNNEWGEVKEMEDYSLGDGSYCKSGISLNGSYYWMITQRKPKVDKFQMITQTMKKVEEFEIICFDCKHEKLKKVAKPGLKVEVNDKVVLAPIEGHLCLLVVKGLYYKYEMIIMRKDNEDEWMELKVIGLLPHNCPNIIGFICSVNENEIMLEVDDKLDGKLKYLLFDQRSDSFVEFERNQERNFPVQYLENLLLL